MSNLRHYVAGAALAALAVTLPPALAQTDDGAPIAAPGTATRPADVQPAETGAAPGDADVATKAKAAVEALLPQIQDVQVVGPWSDGSQEGVWRTVMVQSEEDQNASHFFVQQLEAAGADLRVRATTEITEINQIEGAVVGYRADEPSDDQPASLTLFFDILPSDGEIAETYELHFFPGEPYNFGPATN